MFEFCKKKGGGSEVAMEASKMVLLDNSFNSLVVAIENGRMVFDSLRKVILYLLPAGSFAQVVPIILHICLGVPTPLSSFQVNTKLQSNLKPTVPS